MEPNMRVLIIDDDPDILEIYRKIFGKFEGSGPGSLKGFMAESKTHGQVDGEAFQVTMASQGGEGVNAVSRSLTDGRPYAVAFVDMRMPPGINGLETARQIRALDDNIHLIIVTAYDDCTVNEMQASLKHDVVLKYKPVTRDEILQLARNACNSWNKGCENRQVKDGLSDRNDRAKDSFFDVMDILWEISDGVLFCNAQGIIQTVNPAGVQMLQAPPTTILSRCFLEIFKNMEPLILDRLAHEQALHNLLTSFMDYDGNMHAAKLNIFHVTNDYDKRLNIIVIMCEL